LSLVGILLALTGSALYSPAGAFVVTKMMESSKKSSWPMSHESRVMTHDSWLNVPCLGVLKLVDILCCSVLQRVAACCRVLPCVAMWCSLLQRVAACCSVLQRVATYVRVLQGVAISRPSPVFPDQQKYSRNHTAHNQSHISSSTLSSQMRR